MAEITMEYDETEKRAVIRYGAGRQFKLSNVTREQAENFKEKHAAEFAARDGILQTPAVDFTRERR